MSHSFTGRGLSPVYLVVSVPAPTVTLQTDPGLLPAILGLENGTREALSTTPDPVCDVGRLGGKATPVVQVFRLLVCYLGEFPEQ